MLCRSVIGVLTVVTCLVFAPTARADFAAGQDLFDRGDFTGAYDEWYISAALFDPDAMFGLAGLYETGQGVERDLLAAAMLYRISEGLGMPEGLPRFEALVTTITRGLPRAQRLPHLIEIFNHRLAPKMPLIVNQAQEGNPRAQFVNGALHAEGIGVAANLVEGYRWLRIAEPSLTGEVVSLHVAHSLELISEGLGGELSRAEALAAAYRRPLSSTLLTPSGLGLASVVGFFEPPENYLADAVRLTRAVVMPLLRDALAAEQRGVLDGVVVEFPSRLGTFHASALHSAAAGRIAIPVGFLKLVGNANDAAIDIWAAGGCATGVIADPALAACDNADLLVGYFDHLRESASADFRRGSASEIAPLISFDLYLGGGGGGGGVPGAPRGDLDPVTARAANLAASLTAIIAHQIGHLVIGDAQIGGDVEERVRDFAAILVAGVDTGTVEFPAAALRTAQLALSLGQ